MANPARVVIPVEDYQGLAAVRSGHFGHAPWLTIVDLTSEGGIMAVHAIPNADHDAGGCGAVIGYIMQLEATAIITGGMGMRPLSMFGQAGVTVYLDRESTTAQEALANYLAGTLPTMDASDACQH